MDKTYLPISDSFKWLNNSLFIFIFICLIACSTSSKSSNNNGNEDKALANIISVHFTGSAMAYTFSVGIQSPDTGCGQYADWWEVIDENGNLLYRRILAHSHVNEQPFVRSGGPVVMGTNDVVYVRAHMHPAGYGGSVFIGSVENGFEETNVNADFAQDLETAPPQPADCGF